MTSNALFGLVLGGVVVGGIVAIALFKKTTDTGAPEGPQPTPGTTPVNPNVPEWARTITDTLAPLAQIGTAAYTTKLDADLARMRARQGMAGYQRKPSALAGYSHSISA